MLPVPPRILTFENLPSTQDAALECVRAGRREVDAVRAVHQTQGRGRRSADWFSEPGSSLAISYVLWDEPVPPQPWVLAMAMAAAVASACEDAGAGPMLLKWPNDVLIAGRKVAGVLTEVACLVAVVGVGLNVNNLRFPPELADRATSLLLATGREWDVDALERAIWRAFREGSLAMADVVRAFRERDGTTGMTYSSRDGRSGVARGIDDEGYLRVVWEDGTDGTVAAAEPLASYPI
jgi:BirA family biotin operon repressor/biotin-[acetyl-CoA-carboxylase] ligase